MSGSRSRRHHYVPQFYLRRFACLDDPHKVMVLERHGERIVADRKSIDRIGYEEELHDYSCGGEAGSIEDELNRRIETPFTRSSTWAKIIEGAYEALNDEDKLPIYLLARHLQRRNLETLQFIQAEHARYRETMADDLTDEERAMHRWIANAADNAHALFRTGALDVLPPADAGAINVMVCRSPIDLRSSTNPTLLFSEPGHRSVFGRMFDNLRTWWLSLGRTCGAFIIAGGPPGFSQNDLPGDAARMINRQYLVQHLNSLSVRYLMADDEHLPEDLVWAGYAFEQRTTHGFRYRKP
jgi:hypothetical protein